MRISIFISLFILLIAGKPSISQELNCQVQVVHKKIQGTSEQTFQAMQTAIYEYMNNTRWTDHVYSNNERIECSLLININEQPSSDKFVATIQIQSRRPVFNTSYNTVMFNHKEKDKNFIFNYVEQQSLEFNENSYNSLTSTLAYYAFIILGFDYDSFSLNGGSPYFKQAEKIVSLAQSNRDPGWQPYEDQKENNRYWLIENILNETYSTIRQASFFYHRFGLDVMSDKVETGRNEILKSIRLLKKAYIRKPSLFLLTVFFTAKSDEIVKVFSEGPIDEKMQAYNLLAEIDMANATKYESIKKQ